MAMKKWTRGLILLGCSSLAMLVAGRELLRRQVPGELLGRELGRTLGHPVRFQSFQLSWDARLRLTDLELLDPDGKVFLSIAQTQVDLDRSLALRGKVEIRQLLLQHPRLELSGPRWRKLTSGSRPASPARGFPVLLRDFELRWLNDSGDPTWEVKGWQGSLPPTPAASWKLGLQGPAGEVFEAEGQETRVALRLERFPVSQLATVATGAHYPSLEETARVSLQAELQDGQARIRADLSSRAFSGPVELQLKPDRSGRLSTSGGQLHLLGKIGAADLSFAPIDRGWKLGPAHLQWKDLAWTARGQIVDEDRFEGQFECAGVPFGPGSPLSLSTRLEGSARQQQARYRLNLECPKVQLGKQSLGSWNWQASGQANANGLPDTQWQLKGPRASWTGSLNWQARSGDLHLKFAPLRLEQWLPGCKGQLQAGIERAGQGPWKFRLSAPRLQLGSWALDTLAVQLSGNPPIWSGAARLQGGTLSLKGPLEKPELEGSWQSWPHKELQGKLRLRVVRDPKASQALATVEHQLSWQKRPLPKVEGRVILGAQGFRGQQLALAAGPLKLPLQLSGGWGGQDWKVVSQFSNVLIKPLTGLDGSLTGKLELGPAGWVGQAQLRGLGVGKQPLGNWQAVARKPSGKAATLQFTNPALALPGGLKVAASLKWTEGSHDWVARLQGKGLQGTMSLNPGKRQLQTQGRLDRLSLAGLPGVPLGASGSLSGNWSGQGPWDRPQWELKGELAQFRFLSLQLPTMPLLLRGQGGVRRAELGPGPLPSLAAFGAPDLRGQVRLELEAPEQKPVLLRARLEKAQLGNQRLADLQLSGQLGKSALEEARLSWAINPPLLVTGTLGSPTSLSARLEKHSLAELTLGRLPCQGSLTGKATYEPDRGAGVEGQLEHLVVSGQTLGSGKIKLQQRPRWKAEGQEFQAAGVGMLQQRYPGLQGRLDWQAWQGPTLEASLNLTAARWQDQPFPDLHLETRQEGQSWPLTTLKAGLQPPLLCQGRIYPEEQRLELHGKLDGQTLADLSRLAGGANPPDVACRLQGDFNLNAQAERVKLAFRGRALGLNYRGISLGDGHLQIAAQPELAGELLLDRPLELQGEAIPASLRGVLPLQTVLSVVRLRGVKFGGRLEAPGVTPLWTLPQVKIKLPF